MTISTWTQWPRWIGHPVTKEWRVFQSRADVPEDWIKALEAPPHPLDHDGDGRKGGSRPGPRTRKPK
jgi:hypothetical protein